MLFFNMWHRQLGRKNHIVIERVRENQALEKEASGFPQYCLSPSVIVNRVRNRVRLMMNKPGKELAP